LAEDNLKRHEKLFQVKAISKYELDVARTRAKTARSAVNSAKARLEAAHSGVKAAQARMKQAQLPMERSSIYAPFDGILTYVNIQKGDYFAPNLVNSSSEEALAQNHPHGGHRPHTI
jgi:multidrug resistance efflux pump